MCSTLFGCNYSLVTTSTGFDFAVGGSGTLLELVHMAVLFAWLAIIVLLFFVEVQKIVALAFLGRLPFILHVHIAVTVDVWLVVFERVDLFVQQDVWPTTHLLCLLLLRQVVLNDFSMLVLADRVCEPREVLSALTQ